MKLVSPFDAAVLLSTVGVIVEPGDVVDVPSSDAEALLRAGWTRASSPASKRKAEKSTMSEED